MSCPTSLALASWVRMIIVLLGLQGRLPTSHFSHPKGHACWHLEQDVVIPVTPNLPERAFPKEAKQ
eukprot:3892425-Amphidinium_carterae.2